MVMCGGGSVGCGEQVVNNVLCNYILVPPSHLALWW